MGKEYVESEIRLKPDTVVGVLWLEQNTLGNHAGYRRLDAYRVSARTGMCVSILDSIVPFLPIFIYVFRTRQSITLSEIVLGFAILFDLHLYKSFIFLFFIKYLQTCFETNCHLKKIFFICI